GTGRNGARAARHAGNAADGCARRDAPPGGRAPVDVVRIPAEMTMAIDLHANRFFRDACPDRRTGGHFAGTCVSRRELLFSSGVLFAWSCLPKVARAEGRDPRLLVMVLRGALDGLAAVAPVGDPEWARLRGDKALGLAPGPQGAPAALPLDGFFALNPAMPNLHRMYRGGQ